MPCATRDACLLTSAMFDRMCSDQCSPEGARSFARSRPLNFETKGYAGGNFPEEAKPDRCLLSADPFRVRHHHGLPAACSLSDRGAAGLAEPEGNPKARTNQLLQYLSERLRFAVHLARPELFWKSCRDHTHPR